jgi:UDP-N-acetylmuramate--alanine ligase
MRLKYGVAVGGSHGKTTTTSMVAVALQAGGLDPTVVIGGRLDSLGGTNARRGAGEYLVAEADESDGSFLSLAPTVALVTNIDPEHLDHFGTVARLEDAFAEFCNRVPFYGFVAACFDHPRVLALVPRMRKRVVGYGFSRQADVRATDVRHEGLRSTFEAWRGDERLGTVHLGVPGRHNVQNAAGALAVALELSVPFDVAAGALAEFRGVQRRFTVVGNAAGAVWVDDYAHHPVEIAATLEAAETAFPGRRLVALFQPHRYTRVRDQWDEFCRSLHRAAVAVVLPVYAAGEAALAGVDHERLAAGMRESGHRGVEVVGSLAEATSLVATLVRPGDVVLALGAGDVGRVVRELGVQNG